MKSKKQADLLSGFKAEAAQKEAVRQARMKMGKPVSQGPESERKLERSKTVTDPKSGKKFRTFARLREAQQRYGGGSHRGME